MHMNINYKKAIIFVAIFLIFNIALVLLLTNMHLFSISAEDDQIVTEVVLDDALRVGKFYLNGDTSSSFIEVYEDGTLQWQNFDFDKYLAELNAERYKEDDDPSLDYAREEYMRSEKEWLSSRHNYSVVYYDYMDVTSIVLEYDPKSEFRRGFKYTDEFTIDVSGNGNMVFKYVA